MKKGVSVAVLADVHGNYLALKACLDAARRRGIRHYLFLGDYITDFPYPQRTLELLSEMKNSFECRFIRGNREDYMIGYRENGGKQEDGTPWRDCSAQGALLYCYENLRPQDIDWFESLPIFGSWQIQDAAPLAYCHGSPDTTRSSYARDPAVLEKMASVPEKFLVTGHVHRFRNIWFRGGRIVSAGSVGIPTGERIRLGKPGECDCARTAQMVILQEEDGGWAPELVSVPYDWQGAIDTLESSGLTRRAPVWAALLRHTVCTGKDPCSVVPARAQELYRLETGRQAGWAQVPEEYWRRAAREFSVELF